ncbi:hypothetical protein ACFPZ0_15815 [Streptomonospora nanhaiensis]|uniref:protein kinase domain-containing protein n=1 Tax=Streptomonospora nanhaiensis TaxID=1323731 RepID=UPI001C9A24AF|nr:hypothetical protein [Streptomonospora nanhaiensis]MBX9387868.1 hypothetical protein [Streptomonospora nanhaiensis]
MSGAEHESRLAPGFHSLEVLHRGAASTLYRALRDGTREPAALKVMRDESGAAEIERLRELARLPGVVRVLGRGRTFSGRIFVAMEYCTDGDYAINLRRRHPLPVEEVVRVGSAVATALEAVHAKGLLYHGIEPSNMLKFGDAAVLTDAGDVLPMDTAPPVPEPDPDAIVHAPPEVLRGEGVGPASDLYRLASCLWTLLAEYPPFADGAHAPIDPFAYRDRALVDPPPEPPRADVPRALWPVFERALAKDPADRFASAAEFRAALRLEIRVTAPAPVRRRPEERAEDPGAAVAAGAAAAPEAAAPAGQETAPTAPEAPAPAAPDAPVTAAVPEGQGPDEAAYGPVPQAPDAHGGAAGVGADVAATGGHVTRVDPAPQESAGGAPTDPGPHARAADAAEAEPEPAAAFDGGPRPAEGPGAADRPQEAYQTHGAPAQEADSASAGAAAVGEWPLATGDGVPPIGEVLPGDDLVAEATSWQSAWAVQEAEAAEPETAVEAAWAAPDEGADTALGNGVYGSGAAPVAGDGPAVAEDPPTGEGASAVGAFPDSEDAGQAAGTAEGFGQADQPASATAEDREPPVGGAPPGEGAPGAGVEETWAHPPGDYAWPAGEGVAPDGEPGGQSASGGYDTPPGQGRAVSPAAGAEDDEPVRTAATGEYAAPVGEPAPARGSEVGDDRNPAAETETDPADASGQEAPGTGVEETWADPSAGYTSPASEHSAADDEPAWQSVSGEYGAQADAEPPGPVAGGVEGEGAWAAASEYAAPVPDPDPGVGVEPEVDADRNPAAASETGYADSSAEQTAMWPPEPVAEEPSAGGAVPGREASGAGAEKTWADATGGYASPADEGAGPSDEPARQPAPGEYGAPAGGEQARRDDDGGAAEGAGAVDGPAWQSATGDYGAPVGAGEPGPVAGGVEGEGAWAAASEYAAPVPDPDPGVGVEPEVDADRDPAAASETGYADSTVEQTAMWPAEGADDGAHVGREADYGAAEETSAAASGGYVLPAEPPRPGADGADAPVDGPGAVHGAEEAAAWAAASGGHAVAAAAPPAPRLGETPAAPAPTDPAAPVGGTGPQWPMGEQHSEGAWTGPQRPGAAGTGPYAAGAAASAAGGGSGPYPSSGAGTPGRDADPYAPPLPPLPPPPSKRSGSSRGPLYIAVGAAAVTVVAVAVGAVAVVGAGGDDEAGQSPPAGGESGPPPSAADVEELAPTDVTMDDSGTTVVLEWTDNTGGTASHHVVGGPIGTTPVNLADVEPGETTATVNGLNAGQEYCFVVLAVLSVEEIGRSEETCTQRAEEG